MPGGRPSTYDPAFCDILDGMGDNGEGMAEAIVAIGCARETFYSWQKQHEEFSNAVKAFRARSQAWWEDKGRTHTFDKGEGFSATSYIFQMKNRFPDDWRDKQEVEDVTPEDAPVVQGTKDLARALAAILSKGIASKEDNGGD